MCKGLKILGVCLISLIPLIIGAKKYVLLINRHTVFKEFLLIYGRILDEIEYSKDELYHILEKQNNDFFVFNNPIKINAKRLENSGLTEKETTVLEDFLMGAQRGDREYVRSVCSASLKEIEELKNIAEQELTSKGRVYITTFAGVSAMVFLVLI